MNTGLSLLMALVLILLSCAGRTATESVAKPPVSMVTASTAARQMELNGNIEDLTLYSCPSWLQEFITDFDEYKKRCDTGNTCGPDESRLIVANVDNRLEKSFVMYLSKLPSEILYIKNSPAPVLTAARERRLERFIRQPILRHTRYLVIALVRPQTTSWEVERATISVLKALYAKLRGSNKEVVIWNFPYHITENQYLKMLDGFFLHMRPYSPENKSDVAVLVVRTDCNIS